MSFTYLKLGGMLTSNSIWSTHTFWGVEPWKVRHWVKKKLAISLYISSRQCIYIKFSFTQKMFRRNVNFFFLLWVNTNFGKRSFFCSCANLWNSLPRIVIEAVRLSSFKKFYNDLCVCFCCVLFVCMQGFTKTVFTL